MYSESNVKYKNINTLLIKIKIKRVNHFIQKFLKGVFLSTAVCSGLFHDFGSFFN